MVFEGPFWKGTRTDALSAQKRASVRVHARSGRPLTPNETPNQVGGNRPRSRRLVDGPARAGARSMMRAVGYRDEDFRRPLIGVAHSWIEIMPCNFNHRQLAEWVKEGIREAGGTPVEFNTIAVSDGIAMGTEGMKASLISREVAKTGRRKCRRPCGRVHPQRPLCRPRRRLRHSWRQFCAG